MLHDLLNGLGIVLLIILFQVSPMLLQGTWALIQIPYIKWKGARELKKLEEEHKAWMRDFNDRHLT